MGLTFFLYGGELKDFLFVEGIYRVLSLLAEERKEGNPFFISEKDAQEMVGEVLGEESEGWKGVEFSTWEGGVGGVREIGERGVES